MEWWWGPIAVVICGGALVLWGWRRDAHRERRALQEAAEPPTTPIPGLPDGPGPSYVQEHDLPRTPAGDLDSLVARRGDAASLPGGLADPRFADADREMASVETPSVLVLADPLTDERQLSVILAKGRGRSPLVVVAPGYGDRITATLRANAATGALVSLPILLTDARDRRKAVALTSARLVEADDLASGWLPDDSWGRCEAWLADPESSWVWVSGRAD